MGREIRMVVPNWEHPKTRSRLDLRTRQYVMDYQPMRDQSVEEAWAEWQDEFEKWKAGEHERIASKYGEENYPLDQPYLAFCEWNGMPPDPAYYRPEWKEEDRTWIQVYETVSEGTPVTPPFATPEELVDYLVEGGDDWDRERRAEGVTDIDCGPWSREAALAFIEQGSAFSLVVQDGKVMSGVEFIAEQEKK